MNNKAENQKLDIKKTNLEIGSINNPVVFLFNLITHREEIEDQNLSICLRLFIKHHSIVVLEYNWKQIFLNELKLFPKSWDILKDFYKLIDKKLALVFILKKWHSVYINDFFWGITICDQIDFLQQTKERFMSIYDCSRGGLAYHYKLSSYLKNELFRYGILEDSIQRLKIILEMFGHKIFQSLDIPLIQVKDFLKLTDDNIIKYFVVIYDKFTELLNQTIKLFDSYNLVCIQLNNLINPIIIKINSITIDSETEEENIKMFCDDLSIKN